jgi:transposase-like protein
MRKSTKFSPEVRERAVRMVLEHRHEHSSQWYRYDILGFNQLGPAPNIEQFGLF